MTAPALLLLILALLVGPCILARREPRPPQRPIRYGKAKGRPKVRDHVAVFLYERR